MSEKYHYCTDGDTVTGPLSVNKIHKLLLPDSTRICKEGQQDWQPLSALPPVQDSIGEGIVVMILGLIISLIAGFLIAFICGAIFGKTAAEILRWATILGCGALGFRTGFKSTEDEVERLKKEADGYGGRIIGRVTSDGRVWNDGYGGGTVGRVTSDGRVWNDGYGGSAIGRVTSDGRVWNDGYGGSSIGRVTDGQILEGGAALLLLLRH